MVDDRHPQRGERRTRPASWSGPGRARPAQPQTPARRGAPPARAAGGGPRRAPGGVAKGLGPASRRGRGALGRGTG
ncbi:hypothetical protein BST46_19465, partial [Mycobacterium timonense]